MSARRYRIRLPWAVLALLGPGALAGGPAAGAEGTEGGRADGGLRWGRLELRAAAPLDTAAWNEALDLQGRRVQEAPLGPAITRGLRALARGGWPFAEARPGSFEVRDGRLVGTVRVDPGVLARIEGMILDGANLTRPGTALRVAGIDPGQPYTGAEDLRARERLARSGLFAGVGEVELLPGSVPETVVLKVPVTEPAYTRFSGILGVSGRESRLTGLLDLDLGNIAGTARSAAARWENRGDGLTRFALRYREPWLPLVPVGLAGSLAHDVREGDYSYTNWEVVGDVAWGNRWSLRLGRGGTRAVEADSDRGSINEGFVMAGLALDRRDSALNPTAGFRLALESRRGKKRFTPFGDSLAVRLDRSRWDLQGEGYRRFGRQWLAVFTTRFLYLDTPEDSLSRWDLFAVGGATSLRGYREEQFLTPAAWVVTGEWRWLQDRLGSALYVFADAAFIAPREGRDLRDTLRRFLLGTGVGVRQAGKLGVLGVEYGIAKGESPLDGRVHLRLDAVF